MRSTFVQLRFRPLGGNVPALNLCGGLLELSGQVGPLDGINCHIFPAILGAFGRKLAQHHVRVIHKILVDREPLGRLAHLHPLRFPVDGPLQLLQKEISETTSVPALALKALLGSRTAPSRSARWARYLRAELSLESIVKRLVTKATTPPGLTWSRALAKK